MKFYYFIRLTAWIVTLFCVITASWLLSSPKSAINIAQPTSATKSSASFETTLVPVVESVSQSIRASSETIQKNLKPNPQQKLDNILSTLDGQYGIFAKNVLTGEVVSANKDAQFVTASIYKLLELYPLVTKIQTGELSWDTVSGEYTVRDCVDLMIRYSDNDCGVSISDLVGLQYSDSMLKDAGLSQTTLNNINTEDQLTKDKITTASDVGLYLEKLFYGSEVDNETKTFFLNLLEEQIYRQGIPSGVQNSRVYNKVGFLDEYLSDAGIVIGDSKEYIIVILTSNSDWESISTIAKTIDSGW